MFKWLHNSIRNKALVYVGVSLAIALLAMTGVLVLQLQNTIVPLTEDLTQEIVKARSAEVGAMLDGFAQEIQALSMNGTIRSGDRTSILSMLVETAPQLRSDYEIIFFADTQGDFLTSLEAEGNISDRDYFDAIINRGQKSFISLPMISRSTNRPIITVAHEVRNDQNQRIGLFAATVELATISNIVTALRVGDAGYGTVVDQTGRIIAHPDSSLVMELNTLDSKSAGYSNLDTIGQQMISGESGIGRMTNPAGENIAMVFAPIPHSPGWAFSIQIPQAQLMAQSDTFLRTMIFIIVGILIAMLILVSFVISLVVRPIKILVQAIETAATGDLTTEANITTSDELGTMGKAFNRMMADLRGMMTKVVEGAEQTSSSSSEVASAVQETSASVEEVASTANQFASTIESTSTNSQKMAELAKNTTDKTNQGAQQIQKTVATMQTINDTVEELSHEISGLDNQSEQIRSIVDIITGIADQTNLLALNAAIEAARAGEHGRGFAVVAEEVRKLAEQSGKAAGEITGVIGEMRKVVQGTVNKSRENSEKVTEGMSLVKNSGEMFAEIQNIVHQLSEGIQSIASASEMLASSGEEIAASSEEQSASVEQIGASIQNVANIADELKELVNSFKI